jgi:hypothetical protein
LSLTIPAVPPTGLDRAWGALLFLPVPIVLFLYTRAPLGLAPSLVVGIAIMATHRLYARPFALARAARRCLWCGGPAGDGPAVTIDEPLGTTAWRACGETHADRVRRFFGWASAHRRFLQVGILGALAAFLAAAGWAALSGGGPVPADAVNAFRLAIALIVLPLSVLFGRRPAGAEPIRAPFPVHIQALLGTWATVWLFRVVGAAWLVLALAYFARRL